MARASYNIIQHFDEYSLAHPDDVAIVVPQTDERLELVGEHNYTFGEIHRLARAYRAGLLKQGFRKGDRLIILLPVTIEVYALMMGLWSIGVVAVFLDPGIGLKKIIVALQDSRAKGIVSIDKLLKFRWFLPPLWFKQKYSGDSEGLFLRTLEELKSEPTETLSPESLDEQDHVLITYTSGSTGRAKGTNRNAGNFYNQVHIIKDNWACTPEEVDFPSFPMFGLLNLCFGTKTIVPAVDFAKVGEQSSQTIVTQIQQHQATRMSGAPRFLGRLTDYAFDNDITLPSMRHIVLGGAAVTKEFCRRMLKVFPNADIKMVYGSTEAAPIAFANFEELVASEGDGTLVGRPIDELIVKTVQLPEDLWRFDEQGAAPYECPPNQVGEVILKGPHVVQGYMDNPAADRENKIEDVDGERWHRTGDVGYFDDQGRLWLTGRASDVIHYQDQVIQPYVVELAFDGLESVTRSAIIQKEKDAPVHLFIQPAHKAQFKVHSLRELMDKLGIASAEVHVVDDIPVDDRHNSKVDRIKLRHTVSA